MSNPEQRYQNAIKTCSWIADHNKEAIREFKEEMEADRDITSTGTICDNLTQVKGYMKFLPDEVDLMDPDPEAFKRASNKINNEARAYRDGDVTGITVTTLDEYIKSMNKFYNVMYPVEKPPAISKIQSLYLKRFSISEQDKLRPARRLSFDQVKAMADAADWLMWQTIILFLFESGVRVGEALDIKRKHVTDHGSYFSVVVPCTDKLEQMETRTINIFQCGHYLRKWLEDPSSRDDPDAPLFVNVRGGNTSRKGDPLTGKNLRDTIVKQLAKDAGLDDPDVLPKDFRHTSATYWGYRVSSLKWMMQRFGWEDPQRAQNYMHDDEAEQRRVTLGMADIDHDGTDQREIDYKPVPCPACGTQNFADTPVCEHCSTTLDDIEAEEPSLEESQEDLERLVANWLRIKGRLTKDDLRRIVT